MKKLTILILAVFLLGIIAVAAENQTDNTTKAGEKNRERIKENLEKVKVNLVAIKDKIQEKRQLNVEKHLDKCQEFLSQNGVTEANATCAKMLQGETRCVDFLTGKGIDEPFAKCNSILRSAIAISKDRTWLKQANLSTDRLEKLDRFVEDQPKGKAFISNLTGIDLEKFSSLSKEEKQRLLNMTKENAEKKLGKYLIKIVKKENLFAKREIAKDRLERAKENYERAKEHYQNANQKYKEQKELLNSIREKAKECQKDTAECRKLRNQSMEAARSIIVNGGKMAIEHLNKIKEKVGSSEDLSNETAAEIIKQIDDAIAKLQEAVNKAKAAQTREDLKAAANQIAQIWKEISGKEKAYTAHLLNSRVWNVVKRSEHLSEKLDTTLTNMEEQGIDISPVKPKFDEFEAKIQAADDLYNQAQELIDKARNETNSTKIAELVKQAREKLNQAHTTVKEAHTLLVEIVRQIKQLGGTIPEDTSADAIQVVDDNNNIVSG